MTTCAGCGRKISGSYIQAMDRTWHSECFKCAGCGKPFGSTSFVLEAGKPFHAACHTRQFAPKCAVCGGALAGSYRMDDWGAAYHAEHNLPRCTSCGRLICPSITRGGVRYGDGREVCNLCRRTAVDDAAAAQRVWIEICRDLSAMGIDLRTAGVPVRLTTAPDLARLGAKTQASRPVGLTRTRTATMNGVESSRRVEEILTLVGLPRDQLGQVLAHEAVHAWLFLTRCPALEPRCEEGLAELVSWLWLDGRRTAEADHWRAAIASNDDPIYGAGFREARQSYERAGLAAVLRGVRERRRLP